jgi:hypothetical protein
MNVIRRRNTAYETHRVLTPSPLSSKAPLRQVEIIFLIKKTPPPSPIPTGIGEQYSQTISFTRLAAPLRRCEPLLQAKC